MKNFEKKNLVKHYMTSLFRTEVLPIVFNKTCKYTVITLFAVIICNVNFIKPYKKKIKEKTFRDERKKNTCKKKEDIKGYGAQIR